MREYRPGGFQQLPVVTKNLLIINVLVFLLTQGLKMRGIDLEEQLGLHYWQSPGFRWWQLITHTFMHANIWHIFFNMFALWMFGRIVEGVLGAQRFLVFYLVCGLGAALCHMAVLTYEYNSFYSAFLHYQQNPNIGEFAHFLKKYVPGYNPAALTNYDPRISVYEIQKYYSENMLGQVTVGASGAVFGILFAFGYMFPNTELFIIPIPFPIKAKWAVTGYAVIELTSGLYNSAGDNIAHFAHLGGMLFAFILLRIWKGKIRNRYY